MKSRKLFASLTGLLIATYASGEIYKWKDSQGQTHFSDTAPKDQPDVKPHEIIISTPIPAIKIPPKKAEKTGATVIEINSSNSTTGCGTKTLGMAEDRYGYWDQWQEYQWKNCHGMH